MDIFGVYIDVVVNSYKWVSKAINKAVVGHFQKYKVSDKELNKKTLIFVQ